MLDNQNRSNSPEYILRRTEDRDYQALNDAYNLFTGRFRTTKQYLWQWLDSPFGINESWVIEHTPTHEIVGHHGVMYLPFTMRGRSIYVGKTENTFVFTDHSGKLFYPRFEKIALNNMKDRFDFIYTTASDEGRGGVVGTIRKRLGYVSIGKRVCFCLYAGSGAMKKLIQLRCPSIKPIAGVISSMHCIVQYVIQTYNDYHARNIEIIPLTWVNVDEVEKFWKNHGGFYGITADRSAKYLTWRFAENPHGKYHLYKLAKGSEIIGYAVLGGKRIVVNEVSFETTCIEDLVVAEGREKHFHQAISAVTRYASKSGMLLIVVLMQNDSLNRAIQRLLGPLWKLHRKEGPEFLVWGKGKGSCPWYYTNILAEGGEYGVSHKV